MKPIALLAAAVASLALAAPNAAAQTAPAPAAEPTPTRSSLGEQGQLVFGAERVLSLVAYQSFKTSSTDQNGLVTTDSTSQSSISFLSVAPTGPIGTALGGVGVPTFYTMPRLGFDYVVIPNLTVGGAAMLVLPTGASHTTTQTANGQEKTSTIDGAKTTLFGLAPRVGYVIALSEMFAIWPRAGFSYYTASLKFPPANNGDQTTVSVYQWAFNAEGLFVLTPFPHVGITAGLAVDAPLTGSTKLETVTGPKTSSTTADGSMWHVGLNAGMIVYF